VPVLIPSAASATTTQVTVSSTRQDADSGHLVVVGTGFRSGMTIVLNPETCESAVGTGWDQPMLVGPQQSFDLSLFPAPFSIRAAGQ
jgi:hypothetical protein